MGKITDVWEEVRMAKRLLSTVLSDGTFTYSLNVFGMRIKGKTIWIYAMFPVFLGVAYLGCAVSLHAFHTLIGIPEFSWTNVFWWMCVLATLMVIFNGGD